MTTNSVKMKSSEYATNQLAGGRVSPASPCGVYIGPSELRGAIYQVT